MEYGLIIIDYIILRAWIQCIRFVENWIAKSFLFLFLQFDIEIKWYSPQTIKLRSSKPWTTRCNYAFNFTKNEQRYGTLPFYSGYRGRSIELRCGPLFLWRLKIDAHDPLRHSVTKQNFYIYTDIHLWLKTKSTVDSELAKRLLYILDSRGLCGHL